MGRQLCTETRRVPSRRLTAHLCAFLAAASFVALAAQAPAAETVTGVTDTEILIGTITDLSGVTAVQGVNNANAVRLAFDEVNEKGGIHGRKIRYIVEDSQYQVPRAVQAMNKLINNDGVFITIEDGGTPMNNATFPMAIEKNMPKLLPLSAARSMYEPFHKLKFSQYSSYVDQMRAGVKYFVEQRGKKAVCAMYQDTDFGKDVLAGVTAADRGDGHEDRGDDRAQADRHRLHRRCRQAARGELRPDRASGTIVRDTTLIIATVQEAGLERRSARPDRRVRYRDRRGAGQCRRRLLFDVAVALRLSGRSAAGDQGVHAALQGEVRRRRELLGEMRLYLGADRHRGAAAGGARPHGGQPGEGDGEHPRFPRSVRRTYTFSPTNHHGATAAFLSVVHNGRWVPVVDHALAY